MFLNVLTFLGIAWVLLRYSIRTYLHGLIF